MGHVVGCFWLKLYDLSAGAYQAPTVNIYSMHAITLLVLFCDQRDLPEFMLSKILENGVGVGMRLQSVINSCTSDSKNFHFQRICSA